ncbi:MAG: OmpA family protein [Chlorobiota bacterium]|nr:OmpA family protein [Chlorobiota bacterium]QQS67514.1 MAG: OmpA family protein [Chlorobiota bacterium]
MILSNTIALSQINSFNSIKTDSTKLAKDSVIFKSQLNNSKSKLDSNSKFTNIKVKQENVIVTKSNLDSINNSDRLDAFKSMKATKDTINEAKNNKVKNDAKLKSKAEKKLDSAFIGKTVYIKLIYEKELLDSVYHWYAGFHGGFDYSFHTSDGIDCLKDSTCPKYKYGHGPGFYLGGNLEWRPKPSFGLLFKMTFLPVWADFNETLDSARVKDINYNIVPLIREHSLSVYTSHLNFDLLPKYIYNNWNFYLGPTIGLLLSKNWTAQSKIISPNNVTFPNNQRDTFFFRNVEIPNTNTFQAGITTGISYDFIYSNHRIVSPELSFNYPITYINSDFNWRQLNLMIGVAIKFGIKKFEPPRIERLIEKLFRDTIVIKTSKDEKRKFQEGLPILKRVDTFELEKERLITRTLTQTDTIFKRELIAKITPWETNGNTRADTAKIIRLSSNYLADSYPILPIIFFDLNSSKIPDRYVNLISTENYLTKALEIAPVVLHRNVLNIIGERMLKSTTSKLKLIGYTDKISENGDCELALARAKEVQSYLVNIWKISPSRVEITKNKGKCVPSVVSSIQTDEAFAENRRVEIETNNPAILAPVTKKTYSDSIGIFPPLIDYDPMGSSYGDDVESWNLDVKQDSNVIFNANGKGAPKTATQSITTALAASLTNNRQVDVILTLKNFEGDKATDYKRMMVVKDSSAGEIKRLWLTFFKVAKNNLDPVAEASLRVFLQGIKSTDEVNIVGYADKLGNEAFNKKLSNTRAKQVSANVKRIAPNAKISKGEGIGSLAFPPGVSSYETPEERFLSRTVQIDVSRTVASKNIIVK